MKRKVLDEARRAPYPEPSGAKHAPKSSWHRAEALTTYAEDIAFGVWSRAELDEIVNRRPYPGRAYVP